MSNCDILLSRIIADPDDLTLRLVYADALDEEGGEENQIRAELLRIGCDLYVTDPEFKLDWRMNEKVYKHSADGRIRRIWELTGELHKMKWMQDDDPLYVSYLVHPCIWYRGMPEIFEGSLEYWSRIGDALCATSPVTCVRFNKWYWGDIAQVRVDQSTLGSYKKQAWECLYRLKGKPEVVYRETGKDFKGYDELEEWRRLFVTECKARTEGVLRQWWPTVREWKGIPTE